MTRDAVETEGLRQFLSLAATLKNLQGEYGKANELLEEAQRLALTREGEPETEIPKGGKLVVALANPVKPIEPATIETNEEAELSANADLARVGAAPILHGLPAEETKLRAHVLDGRFLNVSVRNDVRWWAYVVLIDLDRERRVVRDELRNPSFVQSAAVPP